MVLWGWFFKVCLGTGMKCARYLYLSLLFFISRFVPSKAILISWLSSGNKGSIDWSTSNCIIAVTVSDSINSSSINCFFYIVYNIMPLYMEVFINRYYCRGVFNKKSGRCNVIQKTFSKIFLLMFIAMFTVMFTLWKSKFKCELPSTLAIWVTNTVYMIVK